MPESILGNIGQPMDDGSGRDSDDEDADAERDPEVMSIGLDTFDEREGSAVDHSGGMLTIKRTKKQ